MAIILYQHTHTKVAEYFIIEGNECFQFAGLAKKPQI